MEKTEVQLKCGICGKAFSSNGAVYARNFKVVCPDCHVSWDGAVDRQQPDDVHPREYLLNAETRQRIDAQLAAYTFIAGVTESPRDLENRLLWEEVAQLNATIGWLQK